MSVSRGGCNAGSQVVRVQSEPARLDDLRSTCVLHTAGQYPAPAAQGGLPWFWSAIGYGVRALQYCTLLCVRNRGVGVARLDFLSGLRNCPIARLDFLSYLRNRAFFLRRLRRRPHREVFSRVLSIHTHKK